MGPSLELLRGSAPGRPPVAVAASLAAHALALAGLVLLPLLPPDNLPPVGEVRAVFWYDPPPPPPPPPLRGSGLVAELPRPTRAPRVRPALVAPSVVEEPPSPPEAPLDEPGGVPGGSPFGSPEGMEGGVEGGVVGGVLGGVLGGVIGGTGGGPPPPATDFDRPPVPIHLTRPDYPAEAFAAKVQGTVVLEIVIGEDGHVAAARVLESVRLLDEAALQTVRSWRFRPASRNGQAVACKARAPVVFRLL